MTHRLLEWSEHGGVRRLQQVEHIPGRSIIYMSFIYKIYVPLGLPPILFPEEELGGLSEGGDY